MPSGRVASTLTRCGRAPSRNRVRAGKCSVGADLDRQRLAGAAPLRGQGVTHYGPGLGPGRLRGLDLVDGGNASPVAAGLSSRPRHEGADPALTVALQEVAPRAHQLDPGRLRGPGREERADLDIRRLAGSGGGDRVGHHDSQRARAAGRPASGPPRRLHRRVRRRQGGAGRRAARAPARPALPNASAGAGPPAAGSRGRPEPGRAVSRPRQRRKGGGGAEARGRSGA